mmetsp:Transcript_23430/g.69346  ORF Transcript_23430/g.69346 Transcript_23430/m.69346 type:complete len:218 (+) Transcript_23430:3150-3803(+)
MALSTIASFFSFAISVFSFLARLTSSRSSRIFCSISALSPSCISPIRPSFELCSCLSSAIGDESTHQKSWQDTFLPCPVWFLVGDDSTDPVPSLMKSSSVIAEEDRRCDCIALPTSAVLAVRSLASDCALALSASLLAHSALSLAAASSAAFIWANSTCLRRASTCDWSFSSEVFVVLALSLSTKRLLRRSSMASTVAFSSLDFSTSLLSSLMRLLR